MNRILVPHDNSKLSDYAFQKGLALCGKLNAELFLLTVIGPQTSTGGMSATTARRELEKIDAKAKEYLEKLKKSTTKKIQIGVHTIRDPSESRGINRFVNEYKIDLIVVVPRRHAKWKKALFGSITSKLLKNSNCHIMILKKPKQQNS